MSGRFGLLHHLDEAIELYEARKPEYSRISRGRTDAIFGSIIFNQKSFRWIAPLYEWRARGFQKRGVPVFVHDFVSMEGAPAFAASGPKPWPKLADFREPDLKSFMRAVADATAARNFPRVAELCRAELVRLPEPRFNCMYRHFVESIGRMAFLASQYIARANSLGARSPAGLCAAMIRLHLIFLPKTARIDRDAAPIQADGIPFLQNDVPPIPIDVTLDG